MSPQYCDLYFTLTDLVMANSNDLYHFDVSSVCAINVTMHKIMTKFISVFDEIIILSDLGINHDEFINYRKYGLTILVNMPNSLKGRYKLESVIVDMYKKIALDVNKSIYLYDSLY